MLQHKATSSTAPARCIALILSLVAICFAHTALAIKEATKPGDHPLSTIATQLPASASTLENRTRVIVTHGVRSDGRMQENRGSGVVVGRYYLTVFHNLQPGPKTRFKKLTSYLGGIAVRPVFSDPAADIAIIAIPEALCASWCQNNDLLPSTETRLEQTVRWYRNAASAPEVNPGWRTATVKGRTWSMPTTPTVGSLGADCDSGLVLEVDRPFRPGSSGAGVWDANNRLLGIAQGSYQTRDGRETGYFKPLRCIRGHWPAQPAQALTAVGADDAGRERSKALVSNFETCTRSSRCRAPNLSRWQNTTSATPRLAPWSLAMPSATFR